LTGRTLKHLSKYFGHVYEEAKSMSPEGSHAGNVAEYREDHGQDGWTK